MIDVKRFSGILNKDDDNYSVLSPQHVHAKNIRFTGGQHGLTAQNIKGNFLVSNSDLPAGTNECIGAFFDSVKQRIIWFNYNSNGDHGIYQLLVQTGAVSTLFRCGANSATDILNFSLDYPVHSAAIVYRTTGDGDLLYWTDSTNRPRYLNLDTVAALSPFTADMLNAAKNAPLAPPNCAYGDDSTVNVNNLRKKLFRFAYRWVYKNGEKSTFSPISKVPLPTDGYNPTIVNNPTKNNNISVVVTGGGNDYKTIELVGQYNINDTWGDFFLIDSLGRDEYSITPGATYTYSFYNNGVYPPVDPSETDLYFSWLPDKANTLDALNGNVIIYGGITDGYDNLARTDVDVSVTVGTGNPSTPYITYSYTATASIIIVIGPTVVAGTTYHVAFDYDYNPPSPGYSKSVNYTAISGNTPADVASGLSALLTGANIICSSPSAGVLFVSVDTGINKSISNVVVSVSSVGSAVASAAWKWSCPGRLGLVYFDDRGKTNGVISFAGDSADTTDFAFTTPDFSVSGTIPQVPIVSASINHTPPTWATSYQWVRADLKPKFLYWVTNDYQIDPNYLYIGIQNLVYQGTVNSGFVPSYEFTEGDRVRVIAQYNGVGNFIPYNVQLDMEITGSVQRTMTSPATTGTFLKVQRPTTFPTLPYQTQMLVEIYTPRQTVKDTLELFYEWGEKYDIYTSVGNRYHRGQTADQTASQPATFRWLDGDVYYHGRTFYTQATGTQTAEKFFIDPNYSDYFASVVSSNGRGWVIDVNAKTDYNPVLVRWGGKYQSGTNINQINIFRPNDFDEVDRSRGDIRRLKTRDRILRVFQDRGVGQYGVYARFIQNNNGQGELVTTNDIITSNNINYYQGIFGLCGYPTNLVSTQNEDYFTDTVSGQNIRLGRDGITNLGDLYKGQFYFPEWITPYNRTITRTNGSTAKILGFFDEFDNEYHAIVQGGTLDGTTYPDRHYSFNDTRKGYCCDEYDYHPEFAISANFLTYSWKNGQIYKHDVSGANYCNFYGVQYDAEITVVFNPNILQKKSWLSLIETASDIWTCPEIYTDTMSYGSQRQETTLVASEFVTLEGKRQASFKRDVNSRGGKYGGNFLKGSYVAVTFRKANASNLVTLVSVAATFNDSSYTPR